MAKQVLQITNEQSSSKTHKAVIALHKVTLVSAQYGYWGRAGIDGRSGIFGAGPP